MTNIETGLTWKLRHGSEAEKVVTMDELRAAARAGLVDPSDYVFHPFLAKWMYAADVRELRGSFSSTRTREPMSTLEATAVGCSFVITILFAGWLYFTFGAANLVRPIIGVCGTMFFIAWAIGRFRK